MKKIAAFAAAILTASAAIPYIPSASVEMNVKNLPHHTDYYPLVDEQKTMKEINERNLDIDFNSDGKFDHLDCYLLERYDDYLYSNDYLPEDIRTKIAANADLDGNGTVEYYEKARIFCHFLLYCDIDTSLFAISTYEEYDKELGIPSREGCNSRNFVESLNDRSIYLGVNYLFLSKIIDEGKVNPDVNNDGKFDLADVLDYKIATTSSPCISVQDPETGYYSIKFCPDKKIELDEDIQARVKALTVVQSDIDVMCMQDASALLDYLFLTEPVLPEYSDNTYYEKFRDGAQYYYIGDMVKFYHEYIDQTSISVPSLEEIEEKDRINDQIEKQYFNDIASGKISAPDLNFDNIIDGRDQHIADIFHGDRLFGRTVEESNLTKEEYDNLDKNCDFDHNGISGDDYDLELIGQYIFINVFERTRVMATDSTGEYYEDYANALFMKEMYPDQEPGIFDLFNRSGNSVETYVFPTIEEHYRQFSERVAKKMYLEPDIDGNGTVDELDKKYALSYISFLETGKMDETEIPEDVLERIRTNCDFTHDGNSGLLYDMQIVVLYVDREILKSTDKTDDNSTQYSTEPQKNLAGDANCDSIIDMGDAVIIMQSLANPNTYGLEGTAEYHLTEQGKINGDMDGNGLTVGDALDIQKMLLGFDDKNN